MSADASHSRTHARSSHSHTGTRRIAHQSHPISLPPEIRGSAKSLIRIRLSNPELSDSASRDSEAHCSSIHEPQCGRCTDRSQYVIRLKWAGEQGKGTLFMPESAAEHHTETDCFSSSVTSTDTRGGVSSSQANVSAAPCSGEADASHAACASPISIAQLHNTVCFPVVVHKNALCRYLSDHSHARLQLYRLVENQKLSIESSPRNKNKRNINSNKSSDTKTQSHNATSDASALELRLVATAQFDVRQCAQAIDAQSQKQSSIQAKAKGSVKQETRPVVCCETVQFRSLHDSTEAHTPSSRNSLFGTARIEFTFLEVDAQVHEMNHTSSSAVAAASLGRKSILTRANDRHSSTASASHSRNESHSKSAHSQSLDLALGRKVGKRVDSMPTLNPNRRDSEFESRSSSAVAPDTDSFEDATSYIAKLQQLMQNAKRLEQRIEQYIER